MNIFPNSVASDWFHIGSMTGIFIGFALARAWPDLFPTKNKPVSDSAGDGKNAYGGQTLCDLRKRDQQQNKQVRTK